ncbi:MAG: exo-alpha-sialidase [Thermoanaerobaculia bacterium]|nr:exo-alpha-sialidase [Thermoanaerobaculia bacterium]
MRHSISVRVGLHPGVFLGLVFAGLAVFLPPVSAQDVVQSRGVDPQVDYSALKQLGPWDDRNYQLTKEDLAQLAPNEAELSEAIPAFFRVEMRKAWPELLKTGPAQYPRSALQIFEQIYGGYLVGGKLYTGVERGPEGFTVIEKDGVEPEEFALSQQKFLSGEVRVTTPVGAAESAIKIHPIDTDKVIAGSNGPGSGQRMHYSTDGGATWTQTLLPLGGTCCDPTVDWSSDGTKAYAATLGSCTASGCGVWFYRSADGGATWTDLNTDTPGDPRRELTTSGSDKEYLHVDTSPTSPHQDNLYLTWHNANVMRFARSTDLGNTWAQQAFSSASDQRGIGSDITTDAAGSVYYFWPAFNSRKIWLRKSTDGGVSFAAPVEVSTTFASFVFPIPSIESRDVFVYVSADTDRSGGAYSGSIYAAWTDSTANTVANPALNHARIQVAYSRDGGASWTVTTPHEIADAASVDRWHQWLAVGPDGKVHVIFYDTRRDPARTKVDIFYSYSTDGAQTFSTPERLTALQSPNIVNGFEFGDYNGLDAVMTDVIGIFTDNRNEAGGTGDSVDVYAAGFATSVCGNNTIEPPEDCDGTTLGGQTCIGLGFRGGRLACDASCQFDTSACVTCISGTMGGPTSCKPPQVWSGYVDDVCTAQGSSRTASRSTRLAVVAAPAMRVTSVAARHRAAATWCSAGRPAVKTWEPGTTTRCASVPAPAIPFCTSRCVAIAAVAISATQVSIAARPTERPARDPAAAEARSALFGGRPGQRVERVQQMLGDELVAGGGVVQAAEELLDTAVFERGHEVDVVVTGRVESLEQRRVDLFLGLLLLADVDLVGQDDDDRSRALGQHCGIKRIDRRLGDPICLGARVEDSIDDDVVRRRTLAELIGKNSRQTHQR